MGSAVLVAESNIVAILYRAFNRKKKNDFN